MWMRRFPVLLALGCVAEVESEQMAPPPDFTLEVDQLIAGERATFAVRGAPPFTTVVLGYSRDGVGDGPCPSVLAQDCLGVLHPVQALPTPLMADVQGRASITLSIPPFLEGEYLGLQAVVLVGSGLVSNAAGRLVLPAGTVLLPDGDTDGDGFSINDGDCNDVDSSIYPGAPDLDIDGVDGDCDGVDNLRVAFDDDLDGFCEGTVCNDGSTPGDCYDGNADAYPGQTRWFRVDRGDGSFDYDCSGGERRRWTDSVQCGCPQGTLLSAPFSDGWDGNTPGCGVADDYVLSCDYVVQSFPNPLYPVGPQYLTECLTSSPDNVVNRVQQCR